MSVISGDSGESGEFGKSAASGESGYSGKSGDSSEPGKSYSCEMTACDMSQGWGGQICRLVILWSVDGGSYMLSENIWFVYGFKHHIVGKKVACHDCDGHTHVRNVKIELEFCEAKFAICTNHIYFQLFRILHKSGLVCFFVCLFSSLVGAQRGVVLLHGILP